MGEKALFPLLASGNKLSASPPTANSAESKEESTDGLVSRVVSPRNVGIGGSAMPWGLVLLAASTKQVEGDRELDVRPVAALDR